MGRLVSSETGPSARSPSTGSSSRPAGGRRPRISASSRWASKLDDRGAIRIDATLRTTAKRIFAAGDVTGSLPFTHVAGHQGRTVVGNALFHTRRSFSTDAVPWVTFTDPEVGRVA